MSLALVTVLSLCTVCKRGAIHARWTRDWSGSERCVMARRKCCSESNLESKVTRSLAFTGIWHRSLRIDAVECAVTYPRHVHSISYSVGPLVSYSEKPINSLSAAESLFEVDIYI